MTTIEKHNNEIEKTNYKGVSTKFNGYIQFGNILDDNHSLVGYTVDFIKNCIQIINAPNYLYARQMKGYISIYGRSDTPTGVELLGGIPNDCEFLLYVFGKTGQLSPTEDLRSAK